MRENRLRKEIVLLARKVSKIRREDVQPAITTANGIANRNRLKRLIDIHGRKGSEMHNNS